MPDVHFTVGTPGQSCYDAVVSGTKYLIEQGIAHPGKIGLQGHSWSGYQTSYLVTKTDQFLHTSSYSFFAYFVLLPPNEDHQDIDPNSADMLLGYFPYKHLANYNIQ